MLLLHVLVAAATDFSIHAVPTQSLTWAAARDLCADQGQQLAKADTEEAVAALVLALDEYDIRSSSRWSFWIGASDSFSEGEWRWADGSRVTHFAWGRNQPEDTGNEDCVAMDRISGDEWAWSDFGCEKMLHGYACSPPSPPHPPNMPLPPGPPPAQPSAPPAPLAPGVTTRFLLSAEMRHPDPGPRSWSSARDYCDSLGLQLAVVRTEADQAALEALAGRVDDGGSNTMLWIGGRSSGAVDAAGLIPAGFDWVDGSPVGGGNWANWAEGMPARGKGPCLDISKTSKGYRWMSVPCDWRRAFVCSELTWLPAPPRTPPTPPRQPLRSPRPTPRQCEHDWDWRVWRNCKAAADDEDESMPIAAIAGLVVACVAVTAIVLTCYWYLHRRRRLELRRQAPSRASVAKHDAAVREATEPSGAHCSPTNLLTFLCPRHPLLGGSEPSGAQPRSGGGGERYCSELWPRCGRE